MSCIKREIRGRSELKNNNMENICVCGIGGVGGYFGGKLALAMNKGILKNKKIFFLARGKHLDEIKKNGLILNTPRKKNLICKPIIATDSLLDLPDIDIFIICVKSYDLEDIIRKISDKVKNNTIIMPLLNGIDIYERIRAILKNGNILPSTVYLGSYIEKPGMVTQSGGGLIIFGKDPKHADFKFEEFFKIFIDSGISFQCSQDPYPDIWEKYIFVASLALISADTNKTLGEILQDQDSMAKLRNIMEEIVSIGLKKGIKLPNDIVNSIVENMKNFPYELKTSYQRDIEKKGKRNEGDIFGEAIIAQGKKYNVSTPITKLIFSKIKKKLNEI